MILIYTENTTPRLEYVLNFIFREVLKAELSLTVNQEEYRKHKGVKINYSSIDLDEGFRIPASGLLSSEGIENIDPLLNSQPESRQQYPWLFAVETPPYKSTDSHDLQIEYDLDFDVFSAVFYMISRYEEYLPFEPDKHGRFTAENSLAANTGFLETPVVDLWIRDMGEALHQKYPGFTSPEREFRFLPTSDIDLPYAYLHRGKTRTLGAKIRAGLKRAGDQEMRKAVLQGKERDPFDTFSEIEAIHALHKIRPYIFFQCSRYGKFDKSISPQSKAFRELVKQVQSFADTGIHPSYRAAENPIELKKEIQDLSGITGGNIVRSRQHFLKFTLPESYRNYLNEGILEEYSMGFASRAGFRAGTSRPFLFYDLLREEETQLRIIPFQVMDRTLKDYMSLSPAGALEKVLEIAGAVRETGGSFVSIWHNDAFSDYGEWKGWKDVYLQMIDTLTNWSNT